MEYRYIVAISEWKAGKEYGKENESNSTGVSIEINVYIT